MDKRQISEEYTQIMNELLDEREELRPIVDSGVSIICLSSCHKKRAKGKIIFGQCEKVQEKNKWSIPCDFTITLFDPNIQGFTDDQIRTLILHELLHVGVEGDQLFVRPHDLEDFKQIVEEFGVDWAEVDDEM